VEKFKLPKSMPDDLIEELRMVAGHDYVDMWQHMDLDEMHQMDAALFIENVVRFLNELAEAGGSVGERADRVLNRIDERDPYKEDAIKRAEADNIRRGIKSVPL
jgi:hypothetical protein